MRKNKARGLFEDQFRQEKISNMKDPLEQLNRFIRWEDFRPVIDKAFAVTDPSLGGRSPFESCSLNYSILFYRSWVSVLMI